MSREEIIERYQYYQTACIKESQTAARELLGMIELLEDDEDFLKEEQQHLLRRKRKNEQFSLLLAEFGMMIGNGQLGELLETEYLIRERFQTDIDQLLIHARTYQQTEDLARQRQIVALGCLLKDALDMNTGYFEVWETEIKNSSRSIQLTLPKGESPTEELLPFIEKEMATFTKRPNVFQKKISSV